MTPEEMTIQQTRDTITTNRERYLAALDALTEENWNHRYYFADQNGEPLGQWNPNGKTCPNGLAMLGMGMRSTHDTNGYLRVLDVSLGYESDTADKIDRLNFKHSLAFMKEYVRFETAIAVSYAPGVSPEDRQYLRIIPADYTFQQPDGAIDWYTCSSCGRSLHPIRVTTTVKTELANRAMSDRSLDRIIEFSKLSEIPDETTAIWRCQECRQQLPQRMSVLLDAAPVGRYA